MGNNIFSLAIAFGILLALVVLNGFGALSPILDAGRVGGSFTLWPLEGVLRGLRDLGLAFFAVRDLVNQNDLLTRQIELLNADLARFGKAADENRVLREALGFQSDSALDLAAAEILSFDYLNFSQNIRLNRGRSQGIKTGDNVIAPGSILVGIVTEVTERSCVVELLTSSGQAANARTSSGLAAGIVRGEHGLGLILDQVSLSETLKIGDRVVTSGLGGKS